MAIKLTPKQQAFARAYIETGNAAEAYRRSYNTANCTNATVRRKAVELLDNPRLTGYLDKLKSEHEKRHAITVDNLLDELEEARIAALTADVVQASAAQSCTMGKARLLGLDKKIIDVTERKVSVEFVRVSANHDN